MKHALASAPNLNLEKSSHYSRESSVQSFTGVLPQNQGAVSGSHLTLSKSELGNCHIFYIEMISVIFHSSVTGGNWQSFNPPLHPSYYTGPNQVSGSSSFILCEVVTMVHNFSCLHAGVFHGLS